MSSCLCNRSYNGRNCDQPRANCGYEELDFEAGIITYPLSNDSNINNANICTWVIKNSNSEDKVLNITFTKFNLGSRMATNCSFRRPNLELFDGPTLEHPRKGPFCGKSLPNRDGNFISSFNTVILRLQTGTSNSTSSSSSSSASFDLKWLTTERGCGGKFSGMTHGRIDSPTTSPQKTSSGPLECRWSVEADFGKRIQFVFNHLQLPSAQNAGPDCPNFLEIKEGIDFSRINDTSSTIVRFCNWTSSAEFSAPAPVTSAGSSVTVLFRSADGRASLQEKGFQALFHQVAGVCGGVLTSAQGTISPPMRTAARDELVYQPNTACDWLIRALPSERISIRFLKFSVEAGARRENGVRLKERKCIHDVLEVLDGPESTSPLIARLCGYQQPPAYTSSGRYMRIRWKSDGSVSRQGFIIDFVS